MTINKKIEEQVNKTLGQFDQAEKLPADPYFYTRVRARLEENHRQHSVFPAFLRVAFLTALFAVNLVTGFWYLGETNQDYRTNTQQELAEILALDLKLDNAESTTFLFEQD